jgi:hypothetical protein
VLPEFPPAETEVEFATKVGTRREPTACVVEDVTVDVPTLSIVDVVVEED